MANIVYMARSAWTGLLDTIRSKAGITGSMTVSQAASAVESIETGGGGDEYKELVERNISVASGASVSKIGEYAFANCANLTNASFQSAQRVGSYAFSMCSRLTSVIMPSVLSIDTSAFAACSSLFKVEMPSLTNIGSYAFF